MKEKIEALLQAIDAAYKQDEDYELFVSIVSRALKNFREYVETVTRMEAAALTLPRTKDAAAYREEMAELDRERHNCHEAAISSCRTLNRLCRSLQLAPFCPEDADRRIIGDFCLEITADLFQKRS